MKVELCSECMKNPCPHCKQLNEEPRSISMYEGMVRSLYITYKYCLNNNVEYFRVREVKKKISKNEHSRYGDLKHFFPNIISKPSKEYRKVGNYRFDLVEAMKFFKGETTAPMRIKKLPGTDTIVGAEDFRTFKDFPQLSEMLDDDGAYKF